VPATSFISEHSSEYILVPKLAGLLTPHFHRVVPIYFLLTREGSVVSSQCDPSQIVRVVGVFARRPKVSRPEQSHIEVTFNQSLFESARLSSSLGIPTFAGVPLASSIMQLNLNMDCAWFHLTGLDGYVRLVVSLDGVVVESNSSSVEGLAESSLVEMVKQKSQPMEWRRATEHLKVIRRGLHHVWQPFGGGYHPFHLVLCS
jgi:hypothetical protein